MEIFHIALLLAMIQLVIPENSEETLQKIKNRSASIYCGQNLSAALSLVCKGNYNTPYQKLLHAHQKRDYLRSLGGVQYSEGGGLFIHFRKQIIPNESRFRRKRHPRGVYNECCQRPCSYEVLRTYCAE